MKTLHVSAGGLGSRISSYCQTSGVHVPKHLLPLPVPGKTILGSIIRMSDGFFDKSIVWTGTHNDSQIRNALEDFTSVDSIIDSEMTGPMGPIIRSAIVGDNRVYGCAGDFYCEFRWKDFEAFHNSHSLPVSILIAKSVPTNEGARFLLDGHRISHWERVDRTSSDDRINIGCYIIDPHPEVISGMTSFIRHKEDVFFDAFIPRGLVAGYDPGIESYNINTPEVYNYLIQMLSTKP